MAWRCGLCTEVEPLGANVGICTRSWNGFLWAPHAQCDAEGSLPQTVSQLHVVPCTGIVSRFYEPRAQFHHIDWQILPFRNSLLHGGICRWHPGTTIPIPAVPSIGTW